MKKSYIIYSMIAIAAVMACNKVETNEQPLSTEEEKGYDVIYATSDEVKTTFVGSGINEHIEWVKGDQVMVYDTKNVGKIYVAKNGGNPATFESSDGVSTYRAAVYPAGKAKSCTYSNPSTTITAEIPSEQDGTIQSAIRNLVCAGVPKASESNQFVFTAVASVIKIDIPAEKNIDKIEVESSSNKISGEFTATYNSNNNKIWTSAASKNGNDKITVTAGASAFSGSVYITVVPSSSAIEITIRGYSYSNIIINRTANLTALNPNTIIDFGTMKDKVYNPKAFTIDSEGHQVYFAPGNLQYKASTNTWRFAEHQWDFVGYNTDNSTYGTVYVGTTKCSNEGRSETYSGWIDNFGFGTSGYDENAKPYHSYGTDKYPSVDLLVEANYNYDWGRYCYISNDPYRDDLNEAKKWHVMTREQWKYIYDRVDSNDNKKWCKVKLVFVVPGYSSKKTFYGNFILPDDFVCPEGITFTPGNTENTFSLDQFAKMEQNGAVFLPYCAASGINTSYTTLGRYHTNIKGKPVDSGTSGYGDNGGYSNIQRCSVRLVRDVE